jgi:hypothetical protein
MNHAYALAEEDEPPPPEDAIVMLPLAFVMVILLPAVSVVRVNPVPLPMSSAPFDGVEVKPVPPFATAKVPASVIAPVVAVFGVRPVVPALNEVTPPVLADQVAVVPLEVNT